MGGRSCKCPCKKDKYQSVEIDSGEQENSQGMHHKDLEGDHLLDSSGTSLVFQDVTQQQNIQRPNMDELDNLKAKRDADEKGIRDAVIDAEKRKNEKPYIEPVELNTIEALVGKVASFRRIKNKGDSFYAAIAIQYLEYLIYKGNDREFEILLGININDEFNTQLKNLKRDKQPIQFEQLFANNQEFYQSGISLIQKLMPKQYGSENKQLLEKFGAQYKFTIIIFQEGKLNEIQPNILNDKIISLYESKQYYSIAYLSEQKQKSLLQHQQPEEPILVVTQDQLIIKRNSLIDQMNFHGQANQDDDGQFVQVHQMIQQLAQNHELLQKHLAARFLVGYYQFQQNTKTYTPIICSYLQQMSKEQFKQFELLVKMTPFRMNIKDNAIPFEQFDLMANLLLDYCQEFIKNYGYQNGQVQQVKINNRMYNLFVIFFMNLHFTQKEPIVNTNIPDPSSQILTTLANKLNISFLIHQVDNKTQGCSLNVIGNLLTPQINLLLYQNNYIWTVPAYFEISLLNHLLDSTCRGRAVPEEFRRFVGILCNEAELIEEYGGADQQFNQQIRQKLKGYRRIRGDGNSFYTAFFYQYLHLVIYKFNEAQFQQFIQTILNTPISITLKQFKITDNYAYSYEFAKELLWIRVNDRQNQDNDNNNLLINTMADPVGIFYGLAILFLRSYTNQLQLNDERALALSQDDSLTPSLLEWEKDCISNEVMIEMLSRQFYITVFSIDPSANVFTDDKQYGDAGHPKIILILKSGHYQIGITREQ